MKKKVNNGPPHSPESLAMMRRMPLERRTAMFIRKFAARSVETSVGFANFQINPDVLVKLIDLAFPPKLPRAKGEKP